MDLIEPEQDGSGSSIDDVSIEQDESTDDSYNPFGEPEVFPRIGDAYQVEIPPLLEESDLALYKRNPLEVENTASAPFNFLLGLPIPLIWINHEIGNIEDEVHDRYESFKSESVNITCFCLENENSDIQEKQKQCMCRGCHLVPGSDKDSWNIDEKGSYLLGLYLFEKNFFQVKRLVETKNMRDILLFYYAKFYGSREYQRWSDCRKTKSKKIVYGENLFTGLRLQELLCRLLPSVLSEECQNAVTEVTKRFEDGKTPLEEYVFFLKAIVGTATLVEAVGIGKGKKDLTRMVAEPSRANQAYSSRLEIPIGKACASLEPKQIIQFLTGDYRLSKARTSDLFWEAVWPRLLERGWQSEQPKNDSLVFLVPGVKCFSRRKLEKGKDYFDSITDVLGQVASEPTMIELTSEVGEDKEEKKEDELTQEADDNVLTPAAAPTRRCYLQPRTSNRNTGGTMKFTVVDTSLRVGGKPYRVRELRSLTLEASNKLVSAHPSDNSDRSTSQVSSEELETSNTMFVNQSKPENAVSRSMPNGKLPDRKNSGYSTEGRAKSRSNVGNLHDDDKESRKVREKQSSQRQKTESVDNISRVTKRRRRLTACSNAATSNLTINSPMVPTIPEPEMPPSYSGDNDVLYPVGLSQDKLSGVRRSDSLVAEHLQTRTLIDLNEPPLNPDFENGALEEEDDRSNQMTEEHKKSSSEPADETKNSRRQSTRNRPPTARALEALANGFLSVSNRPRKNKETGSLVNFTSRTSRRTPRIDMSACSMESRSNDGGSGGSNGGGGSGSNGGGDPHALSDGNGPAANYNPSV